MTDAINYCKDFKLNEGANGLEANKYGYYNNMATGDIHFNLIADSIKETVPFLLTKEMYHLMHCQIKHCRYLNITFYQILSPDVAYFRFQIFKSHPLDYQCDVIHLKFDHAICLDCGRRNINGL